MFRSGNQMVSARIAPGPSFGVTEQRGDLLGAPSTTSISTCSRMVIS